MSNRDEYPGFDTHEAWKTAVADDETELGYEAWMEAGNGLIAFDQWQEGRKQESLEDQATVHQEMLDEQRRSTP